MKKILSIILTLCMCLTMGAVLTACDFGTTDPGHTHTYETVWSHDDTYHWYACEDETCVETSQKAEHSIENGVCSVCGYEQSAPTPPPTPSANEVTENEFYAATSFDNVTNITIRTESNTNIVNGVQQPAVSSTFYIDENRLKEVHADTTEYVEGHNSYIFVFTYDDEQQKWIRTRIDQTENEIFGFKEYLEGVSYEDFSYEDGFYLGSKTFELGVAPNLEEYTINYKLQFENGTLLSLRADYKVDSFDCYDYMAFSDYGTTIVTLPTEYEDADITPTPPATTSWASYFVFDNVTARKTSSTYYPDLNQTFSDIEDIKVQGDEWLWEKSNYYYNDTTYDKFAVYFDGSNAYVNGVIDNEMNSQSMLFFLNADFSAYESSFTETSTGVFEADEISAYGVYTYTDVCITIREGKIVSIEYTMNMSVSGATYTQTITYMFDLWGDTTVDGEKYTQPSAWLSYFDFENVTINEVLEWIVEGTTHSMETNWNVDDGSWVCNKVMEKVDGIATIVNQAYYDGTNYYLNGTLVSEADIYIYHYLSGNLLGDLIGYESSFNKSINGSKTIYTANSIILYGALTYTDVELTVENGKITKLTYKLGNAALHEGQYYDGTYTLTFSNYGTTIVEGSTEPVHTCSYVKEIVSQEYLRTSATCENLATYYYSCECGKAGTEWFEYGSLADCAYGDWYSNNNGTHSKICSVNNNHILTDDCCGGSATCEHLAICEGCGAEYGERLLHSFEEREIDNIYLEKEADCYHAATYYLSCKCGEKDLENTFEVGEALGHSWSNGVCSRCGEPRVASMGLEYTLDNNYNYSVTGKGTCADTDIIIPETYEGIPVVSIGAYAFKNHDEITSVDMPDGICEIFESAFYGCSSLSKIQIPANVNSIGPNAFRHCTGLEHVDFEFGGLREIGSYAFACCSSLTNVEVPDSVAIINAHAFEDCTELVDIVLGDYVEYVGDAAFEGCPKIKYNTYGTVKYLGSDTNPYIYLVKCSGVPAEIHEQCVTIASYAFYDNNGLTEVVIPDGVKSIGEYAFYGCDGLQKLTIGTGVVNIEEYAFAVCKNLTTINYLATNCADFEKSDNVFGASGTNDTGLTLVVGSSVMRIPACFFYYGSATTTYRTVVDIKFENTVLQCDIGDYAFYNCDGLTVVDIPDNFRYIGEHAFDGCDGIISITIGENVQSIGAWAFRCKNLKEVKFNAINMNDLTSTSDIFRYADGGDNEIVLKIGAKVQRIPARLFMQSNNLVSVIFEQGSICESIGNSAFRLCANLATIYYGGEGNNWNSIMVENYNEALANATIYYYSDTQPTDTTYNYWHYDENGEIVVWEF